jgi:ABC-type multidrug transport system ATPase subunit
VLSVNTRLGTTILLIEHDMGLVMDLSDHVVVLDYGRKIADGSPDVVCREKAVIDAYLGVDPAQPAAGSFDPGSVAPGSLAPGSLAPGSARPVVAGAERAREVA